MARDRNFLLGRAERLLTTQRAVRRGGAKNSPYSVATAKRRIGRQLKELSSEIGRLPPDATPRGTVVAVLSLHPRYQSKSDAPEGLLRKAKLRVIGSRSAMVKPESWGIKKHPQEAETEELFVAGTRESFEEWSRSVQSWEADSDAAGDLTHLETVRIPPAKEKLRLEGGRHVDPEVFEAVLLTGGDREVVLGTFKSFCRNRGAEVVEERVREVGGLAFVPLRMNTQVAEEVAQFAYLRVARPMPRLRAFMPRLLRVSGSDSAELPDMPAIDDRRPLAVFDGGIPSKAASALSRWVRLFDVGGIGPPAEEAEAHGLQVTSALLFGHIDDPSTLRRPISNIDHYRVIDRLTGQGGDYLVLDVLSRIESVLADDSKRYELVNLSLGPELPAADDDVTAWTAVLDGLLAGGQTVFTAAAGNSGEAAGFPGLNRIQPPGDAINLLSVGACDSLGPDWSRATYSSIGPGRQPGRVKPDGVAFGGTATRPFAALGWNGDARIDYTGGTSFAAPLVLRAASGVRAQLRPDELDSLALRALMIHQAAPRKGQPIDEVGWGRFELDPSNLITCDDHEALIVFQGKLSSGQYTRAPIPLPGDSLTGDVAIRATLLLAPPVDPSHPTVYTRFGVEPVFRPHSERFSIRPDGKQSTYAASVPFFSPKNLYSKGEWELRGEGVKWEPCLKREKKFRASSLKNPVLDLLLHSRREGRPAADLVDAPFALVVTVNAPSVPDLYNQVVRAYARVLVPLVPSIQLPIQL